MAVVCALAFAPASAAPLLRGADTRIVFTSPIACEVVLSLTVEGASEVEHRVDAHDVEIELIDLQDAERAGELGSIGRTRVLVARPQAPSYSLRYRARLSDARAYRCPIWLPAVPTDGVSRDVVVRVDLPDGASPGRTMPALSWTGPRGTATIGHLPAFVYAPFAGADGSARPDLAGMMDALAIGVFAVASAAWVWRRKR
jgi:hypothetical protein